jgi:ATP-dependent Clp protease ATP-binding subunit ClpC
MLARRLYLLERALDGLESREPPDAIVELRPVGMLVPATTFLADLERMYQEWAAKRGMRSERSQKAGIVRLTVSGLAAYSLLKNENGLHVFETPRGEDRFDRTSVHVVVVGIPFGGRREEVEEEPFSQPSVIRRYRRDPSPLVRDARRGSRTGRLDSVLDGDFDLVL